MFIELWTKSNKKPLKYKSFKEIPIEYNLEVTFLTIMESDMTGISHIGKRFPNLTHLHAGCNKIRKIDLKYFPNLIELCANKNKITEVIGFKYCPNLIHLELQCNKIQYLEPSDSIIRLCVPGNDLKFINNYPNLEGLGVADNRNFKEIINCPKINYIHAYETLLKKEDFYDYIEFVT